MRLSKDQLLYSFGTTLEHLDVRHLQSAKPNVNVMQKLPIQFPFRVKKVDDFNVNFTEIFCWCCLLPSSDDPFVSTYEGLEKEHNMENLEPGHTYKLRVQCSSRGGCSPVSPLYFKGNVQGP